MAETTEFEEEMSREEIANYLRSIAEEFDHGEAASVRIGNKQVQLQPANSVSCRGKVTERSRLIGSDREELDLTISWTPTKD